MNEFRRWLGPAVVLLVALCGCEQPASNAPEESVPLASSEQLEDALSGNSDAGVLLRLGGDGSDGREWFSRIMDARASHDGSVVVVLVDAPPFVRVFQDGEITAQFLMRGDGPGEARRLNSIGLSHGDSLVAVTHDGRLSVFSLEGDFVGRGELGEVLPLVVHGVCPGAWDIIGPDRASSLPRPVVHRVPERLTVGEVDAVVRDPDDVTHLIPPGGPAALNRLEGGAAVQYGYSGSPFIASVGCEGGSDRVDHPMTDAIRGRLDRIRASAPGSDGSGRVEIDFSRRLAAGFHLDGERLALAETWTEAPEPGQILRRSEITVYVEGDPVHRVRGGLRFSVHDLQPDLGVLVSVREPYPQLLLISSESWEEWVLSPGVP